MKFQKGRAKTGGRQKGTKNKINKAAAEIMQENNVEPLTALIMLAKETDDKNLLFNIYKELASYMYPKQKSVEVTGEIELPKIDIKGI